jgi:glyoxylase-like metal-dependent hydrolase (beta-lactamase superfamily II)
MARRDRQMTEVALSRRTLVGGLAATAAGIVAAPTVRAQTVPHKVKLGDVEIIVISDGSMSLPTSFALPKTVASDVSTLYAGRVVDTAAFNVTVNVAVLRMPGALVVIDSGGTSDFMPTLGSFPDRLEQAGIKAADVTHVVFTHAHADHLWGVIDPLDDDTRFPNARHYMSMVERDYWLKPGLENDVPDAVKGMTIGTQRRVKMLAKRLDAASTGQEIAPGLVALDTAGHTPGHLSLHLTAGGTSLIIGGDALGNAVVSFERPGWHWGPDVDPAKGAATRLRLLDQLATDRTLLLGYHLPWPGFGRVERHAGAFRYIAA